MPKHRMVISQSMIFVRYVRLSVRPLCMSTCKVERELSIPSVAVYRWIEAEKSAIQSVTRVLSSPVSQLELDEGCAVQATHLPWSTASLCPLLTSRQHEPRHSTRRTGQVLRNPKLLLTSSYLTCRPGGRTGNSLARPAV